LQGGTVVDDVGADGLMHHFIASDVECGPLR
jgi:hypothetical protein